MKTKILLIMLFVMIVMGGCYTPENDQGITNPIVPDEPIVPDNALDIVYFLVDPDKIDEGDNVEISWEVLNSTKVEIRFWKEFQEVDPAGTEKLKGVKKSLDFTIRATGEEEIIEETIYLTVIPDPDPPEIVFFKCVPNPVNAGTVTAISWKVKKADKVEVKTWNSWDPVSSEGGWDLIRSATQTMYLRATNKNGTVEASFVLVVQ